jgi:predicted MFS family arabinose efflux permease
MPPQTPLNAAALSTLAISNFLVGSASIAITGLLVPLAADLQIPTSAAAQILAVYAISFAIGAPIVAVLAARVCRKQLLIAALVLFGVTTLLFAISPNFATAAALRFFAGATAAAFVPNTSAVAGALALPSQRGRALAIVFGGFTAALVLGAPIATVVGHWIGWRYTIGALGVAALFGAIALKRMLPSGINLPGASLTQMKLAIAHRPAFALLAIGSVVATANFVLFSFAAIALPALLSVPATQVAIVLGVFGAGNILGNIFSIFFMDRMSPSRVVPGCALLAAMSLLVVALTDTPASWLALFLWGSASFAVTAAMQTRVISVAPTLVSALLPLNASALFVGQSLGAVTGGWWLACASEGHANSGLALIAAALYVAVVLGSVLFDFSLSSGAENASR